MNDSKLVPSFRFIEFKEGYTKKKLKEMASFLKGKGYSKNDIVNYGFPIILYGRMYTNYRLNIKFINDTFVKNDKNSVKSVEGDVIIPASGETAEDISKASNIKRSGIIIGGDINIIRPDNKLIDSSFLALVLSNGKVKQKIAKRAQGKSIVHIHNTDLMSLEIYFPSLDEQQKIGNLFTKLDKLLDLQQQKIDKLELLKKTLLQKLFPKHDAKIPELRFKGFEGDWAKIQLKNYVTWYKGNGLSKKHLNVEKIGAPVIHYSDLYKFSEVIKNVRHWSTTNQGKLISNNSILFPSSDVTPNGLARTSALIKSGVKAGGDIIIGTLETSLSNVFMSYQINRNFKDILRMVSGTTIRHIHANDLSNLSEYITYYPEQQKIGNLLSKVDQLIELENKKLQNFQQVKKCLLQNMFVE